MTDADAHEGLVGGDVGFDGGEVAGGGELGHAVAEVAYAWEDEVLDGRMSVDDGGRGKC